MAGWLDANFTDEDIQDPAFHNMFVDAYNERAENLGSSVLGGAEYAVTTVVAGDHAQKNLKGLQSFIYFSTWEALVHVTAVATITPVAWTGSVGDQSTQDLQQLMFQTLGEFYEAAGLDPDIGLERRRPREITAATDTEDTQGNPAAAGQYAYMISPDRGTWYCNAPGDWVRLQFPNRPPDELSNYEPPPNNVANILDVYDDEEDPEPVRPSGKAEPGDYFGPWLYEDIRDCFRQMRGMGSTLSLLGTPDNRFRGESITASVHFSYASAVAEITGSWPYAYGPGTFWPYVRWNSSTSGSGTPTYGILTDRAMGDVDAAGFRGAPTTVSRSIKFFLLAGKPLPEPSIFDANGDGLVEGVYTMIDEVTTTTDADVRSAVVGSMALPNDAGAAPLVTDETTTIERGYQTRGGLAIEDFFVVGGFTYQ